MVLFHLTKRRWGGACLEADGGKMRQGSACRCLHWPEPVSTWPGPKLMEGCLVLSDHLEIQSPPKDCSSWVSKKGQKETPEDDTRGCFLWESTSGGLGTRSWRRGRTLDLGRTGCWPWGRVSRTSQPPPRQQCWKEQVSVHKSSSHLAGHGGLGENRPAGLPDVWKWRCAPNSGPRRTWTAPRCETPFFLPTDHTSSFFYIISIF